MITLTDKVVLVTGASRGIGAAIADTLGELGATVYGTATSEKGATAITERFQSKGIKGEGLVLNVTDPTSCQGVIEHIHSSAGGVDVLVNNAGITRDNLLLRMKQAEWDDILATNLTPIYQLSKLCLKGMMKKRWGRIVSISSVVGAMGNAGQANYAAAKAGVVGFSKSLAQEVASRGITVNVVAPGFIGTDMTRGEGGLTDAQQEVLLKQIPMGAMGRPEDIAQAVAYLASDAAAYVTGQTLHVNGGMYM